MLKLHSAWLVLAARNWQSLVTFYGQLLNQSPQPCISNVYAEFQLPGLRLGIFEPKASDKGEFAGCTSGSMSLCLEVENLENAIAHLTQLGYPPAAEITQASHGREVYARDPEGNRLILHQAIVANP
ncbi:VOC family protein [Desertifilum sp. FACHB-1129]|uniref:Glyoxalase n=1 Tax=Desertifilum tharense IPPAS B-1220 TaxID=1781255 RepID=A0A1E5QJ72_9CYAN|nr:VOC family protein [Desertifilum tharense]MBD2314505.1 VOC family protein [Desertifilum sp. FACHB-1129]MBD2321094.1 VOC family protein [Desertifilum sp. FACHB-866]MBD2331597.1 VOC family protein [Desertifilum sp. FACHB-868]MDA0213123.1 VOC family protein [Cyanobacteria bacterium FC1]OEJ74725.1 glyoxalase [Desertifilum tharense IPPAS B-1220]